MTNLCHSESTKFQLEDITLTMKKKTTENCNLKFVRICHGFNFQQLVCNSGHSHFFIGIQLLTILFISL